jgi:hypothetical protein
MKRDLEWYCETASEMVERDAGRDKMFAGIDQMVHLEYSLPGELEELEWMRRFVSDKPYVAVKAGVRVLGGREERIRIEPVSVLKALGKDANPESEAARSKANEWERALRWQMDKACRRKPIVRDDIIRSAITYDEICGNLIHLPTQIKAIESLGGNAARQKAAKAFGDFAVVVRNPQSVHVRYSDYMPEAVLYTRIFDPQEIVDFWGKSAAKLQKAIDDGTASEKYVLYDYVDFEGRKVWANSGEEMEPQPGTGAVEIFEDKESRSFLPWICVLGGTNLELAPERQRNPLLYGIYRTGQWVTANILGSLAVSEGIAEAGSPDRIIEGPAGAEGVEYQYGQPGGEMIVKPGHKVTPNEQRPMDPQIRELFDRHESAMVEGTLPRVLLTAEALPGEPFSGYNLRVQQAIASLIPPKKLSERWFAECYRQMLLWAHESGVDIRGYGEDKDARGKLYTIDAEDIDPESIYLSVELKADDPLDQMQRVTSAINMSERLKYPLADILDMMGETDPEGAIKRWMKEQLMWAELQGQTQRIQLETSGQLQMQAQQLAQQMHQQMMEEQAQQAQTGQPSQMSPAGAPPGMMGVEGQMVNPAEGGMPPAQANPEQNVREMQTGMTRIGEEALG